MVKGQNQFAGRLCCFLSEVCALFGIEAEFYGSRFEDGDMNTKFEKPVK